MRFDICTRCKKFVNLNSHNCNRYKCWHGGELDYEITIFADDPADAAHKYAISYNEESGDYPMMNGDDTIYVTVEDEYTEAQSDFEVIAYPVIEYNIKLISRGGAS